MGTIFLAAKPFTPKVVLVTGASAGIGKDAALALIHREYIVYGAARRVDRMQDLVEAGGHAIPMDISKEQEIVAAVTQILEEQGQIDVLVNNAGFSIGGPAEEVSVADGRRQFDVNFFGLARLTQEILPHMRRAGKGTIINVSMGGYVFFPFMSWYVATKHALEGWIDCLRVETYPFGIKIALIQPGAILTEHATTRENEVSPTSVYKPYFENFLTFFKDGGNRVGSPASAVSDAIIQAAESANPKRRYVVGFTARPMLFLRNWLGDAIYDRFMLKQLRGG